MPSPVCSEMASDQLTNKPSRHPSVVRHRYGIW